MAEKKSEKTLRKEELGSEKQFNVTRAQSQEESGDDVALEATVKLEGEWYDPISMQQNAHVSVKGLMLVQFSFPSAKAKVTPNIPLDMCKGPPLFSKVYMQVISLPKQTKKGAKMMASTGISQRFGLMW